MVKVSGASDHGKVEAKDPGLAKEKVEAKEKVSDPFLKEKVKAKDLGPKGDSKAESLNDQMPCHPSVRHSLRRSS